MKKTKINGVELAYRDEGSGKPVVFLHAFPLDQTMWDQQLAILASGYRVVTFDWRGFGDSEGSSTGSTMPIFADDLAGLLDHLEIKQATICGLSMGGYAAFALHRKYANRISALILCDTRATADTDEGKQGRRQMADLARSKGASAIADSMIPRVLGETTLQNNPAVAKRVRTMIEATNPEAIAQASIGMAQRSDSTDMLLLIACPTLIIVGEEDKLTPISDAEKMHQAIASSRLEVIRQTGHLSNLEQPATFNRVISDFLAQL